MISTNKNIKMLSSDVISIAANTLSVKNEWADRTMKIPRPLLAPIHSPITAAMTL
jgi:hypothetical protein